MAWTAIGFGFAFLGLAALARMWWLVVDARKTYWAVSQIRSPRAKLMQIVTGGEVSDRLMKVWAIAVLVAGLAADGLAGVGAIGGWSVVVIIACLIAGELSMGVAITLLLLLGNQKKARGESLLEAMRAAGPAAGN